MKSNFATISIKTPEGIAFNLLLAGIVPRFLGWLVASLGFHQPPHMQHHWHDQDYSP